MSLKNEFAISETWSSKTPTLIPNIAPYTTIKSIFSFRKVLVEEYSGIYDVFIISTLLLAFRNYNLNITPIIRMHGKVYFGETH